MKGLTPRELLEITEFVQKHHKFGYIMDADKYQGHEGFSIKYIDAVYDSRDATYWNLSFRGFGRINFSTNAFGLFNPKPANFQFDNLFDWIMSFLKFEWEQTKEFHFMSDEKTGPLHNYSSKDIIGRTKEYGEWDMIQAYCGDLEDGATSEDMGQAATWLMKYTENLQAMQNSVPNDERSVAPDAQ